MYPLPLYPPQCQVKRARRVDEECEAEQRVYNQWHQKRSDTRRVSQQTFIRLKAGDVADVVMTALGSTCGMRRRAQRSTRLSTGTQSPRIRQPGLNSTSLVSKIQQPWPSAARWWTAGATDCHRIHRGTIGLQGDSPLSAAILVQQLDDCCAQELHSPVLFASTLRCAPSPSLLRTMSAKHVTSSTCTSDDVHLRSWCSSIHLNTGSCDTALSIGPSDKFQQISEAWADSDKGLEWTSALASTHYNTADADLGLEDHGLRSDEPLQIKAPTGAPFVKLNSHVQTHHAPVVNTHITEWMKCAVRTEVCMAQVQLFKEQQQPRGHAVVASKAPMLQRLEHAQATLTAFQLGEEGGAGQRQEKVLPQQQCVGSEDAADTVVGCKTVVARGFVGDGDDAGAVEKQKKQQHRGCVKQQDERQDAQQAVQVTAELASGLPVFSIPAAAHHTGDTVHLQCRNSSVCAADNVLAQPHSGARLQSETEVDVNMHLGSPCTNADCKVIESASQFEPRRATSKIHAAQQGATSTLAESDEDSSVRASEHPCCLSPTECVCKQVSEMRSFSLTACAGNATSAAVSVGGASIPQRAGPEESASDFSAHTSKRAVQDVTVTRTCKTSARGIKATERDADDTKQMQLHKDFLKRALHSFTRRQKNVNLEQLKWSQLLRKRQSALAAKETFRPYSFLASLRKLPSKKGYVGSIPILIQQLSSAKFESADEKLVQTQHLANSCEQGNETGAREKRKGFSNPQTPGMCYQSQMDPGVPPHTFAVAMNYLVSRAIDKESVAKKNLELPAKIAKLLTVRHVQFV